MSPGIQQSFVLRNLTSYDSLLSQLITVRKNLLLSRLTAALTYGHKHSCLKAMWQVRVYKAKQEQQPSHHGLWPLSQKLLTECILPPVNSFLGVGTKFQQKWLAPPITVLPILYYWTHLAWLAYKYFYIIFEYKLVEKHLKAGLLDRLYDHLLDSKSIPNSTLSPPVTVLFGLSTGK